MSFFTVIKDHEKSDIEGFFDSLNDRDVERAIGEEGSSARRILTLLSPAASRCLEPMAQRAHQLTLQYFGKTIQLYTPLYLSNYCVNRCLYCGFANGMPVRRHKLTPGQVDREAAAIAATGLQHVLILTGESPEESPLSYVIGSLEVLKRYFSSISVEIYALAEEEYRILIERGVDGLTLYQETYDRSVYNVVHPEGPKRDYRFRLEAPERAARQKMRTVNIGTLLGLADWRRDLFFTALHAQYLQNTFSDIEVSISVPRLCAYRGGFSSASLVSDRELVQIIVALRLFLPRVGITLSTRERPLFRDQVLPLGITRMSAGSTTSVGGRTVDYGNELAPGQFELSDRRSVDDIKQMLLRKGYQPVLKDWMASTGV